MSKDTCGVRWVSTQAEDAYLQSKPNHHTLTVEQTNATNRVLKLNRARVLAGILLVHILLEDYFPHETLLAGLDFLSDISLCERTQYNQRQDEQTESQN